MISIKNFMNKNIVVKVSSMIVILSITFGLTGCSDILNSIEEKRITKVTEQFINDLGSQDFASVIDAYSVEEVELPELDEEQTKLFDKAYKEFSCKLDYVSVSDSREKATIKLSIKYVDASDICENGYVMTSDEFDEALDDASVNQTSVRLKLSKKDGKWKITDLSELALLVDSDYEKICLIDEDGNPINPSAKYYETIIVDAMWYDSDMGNPMNVSSVSNPSALWGVFYFNKLQTVNFTAQLCLNGDVIATREINMQDNITAECEFSPSSVGRTKFQNGDYTIVLVFNDEAVMSTETLHVS